MAEIQNNAEKKKQLKARMVKMLSLLVIILLMIAVAAMAWFTYSKYLEVTGARMKSTGLKFDLAAETGKGYYDGKIDYVDYGDKIKDVYPYGLTVYENKTQTDRNLSEGYITGSKGDIKWAMSESQNMRNYYEGLTRAEANEDDEKRLSLEDETRYALEPGSEGVLEFYVVPKENCTLDLDFTVDIDLFDIGEEQLSAETALSLSDSKTSDDRQQEIFMRHMLFFRNRTGNTDSGFSYSGLMNCSNDQGNLYFDDDYKLHFTDKIENAEIGNAYKYEIYWVWPYLLGQVLVPNDSPVLSRYHALFSDEDEKKAYVNDMKSNYVNYYYGYSLDDLELDEQDPDKEQTDAGVNVFTDGHIEETIQDVADGKFLISDSDNNYSKLSYFWNKADQFIGISIGYVTAELIVSE